MPQKLRTGWVTIATSGPTIDGRTIEKQWLEDAASNYSEKLFSAQITADHNEWMPNGGSVAALKTKPATQDNLKGEIHLFAILTPNDWLIDANRRGQYMHCSIDIAEDFMGKGFYYLKGLAVTDKPASAGTSALSFNEKGIDKTNNFASELKINTCESLVAKKGLFSFFEKSSPHNQPDADAMDDKQFKTLLESIEKKIDAKFSEKEKETAPSEKEEVVLETDVDKKYSALKTDNEEMKTKFSALEKKFNEMTNEEDPSGTDVPEGQGDAEQVTVI